MSGTPLRSSTINDSHPSENLITAGCNQLGNAPWLKITRSKYLPKKKKNSSESELSKSRNEFLLGRPDVNANTPPIL